MRRLSVLTFVLLLWLAHAPVAKADSFLYTYTWTGGGSIQLPAFSWSGIAPALITTNSNWGLQFSGFSNLGNFFSTSVPQGCGPIVAGYIITNGGPGFSVGTSFDSPGCGANIGSISVGLNFAIPNQTGVYVFNGAGGFSTLTIQAVPEPSGIALVLAGLPAVGWQLRRRRFR